MSDSCLEELACSEDARNLSDSVVGSSNAMSGSREILQKGNADCFGSCDSKATSSEKKDGLVDVCGDVATLSLEKIESFMGERCSLNEDRSEPAAPEGLCSEKEWYPGEIVPENVCRGEEMGFKLSPHNNLLFKSVQQMEQEDDIGGDTSCGEGVEVKEIADVDHQGGGDCGEENQSSQMLYQEIQGCGSSGGMIEKMKHSDFNPINGLGLETHIDVAGSTDSVMGRVDIDTSKRLALEGGESVEHLVCVAAGNSHVQSEEMDDDTVCDHPEKRVEVGKMKHSMGACNDVKTRNCQMPLNESRKADFACNIDYKAEQETFDTSRVCLPRIVSSVGKIDGMDGEEDDSYKERVSLVHCAVESEEATGIGDNFASVNQIDTCSLCKKSSDLSGEESDDLARGEVDTFNRILCSEAGKVPSESEAGSLNHLDPTNDQGVNSTVTGFSSETRVEEKTAAETACFQLLHSKDFPATLEQSCSFTENRQEESTSDCGPSLKDVLEYREQNVDCLGWVEADLCNQISASRVSGMPCERELLGMSLFCEREDAGVVGRPETIDYTSAKINNVSGAFTRDDIKLTEEKCIVSYGGDLCLDRNPNSSGEEVPEIVSPSSQKSSRISKSGRKTQAKRAARNSRNASKVIRPLEAREFVAEAARRKRTSLSKAARASPWGAFPNVSQLFEQMNGLGFGKIKSKRRSKARSGQESNTKDKNQQNGNPQVSDGKGHGSFTRIRLKVKLGKGPGQSSVNIMEVVKSGPSEVSKLQINVGDDLKGKEKSFECLSKNSSYMATENSETCLILEKSSGNVEDYLEIPSQVEIDAVGRTAEGSYLYPETSPDSEVINIVPDSQVGERHRESSGGVVLPSSPEFAACKSLDTSKRGKKKDRIPRRVNHAQKDGSSDSGCVHKDKTSKKRGYKQNLSKGLMPKENLTTSAIGLSNDTQGLPLPKELDQGVSGASLQQEHADFPEQDVSLQLSESENSNKLLSSSKGKGCKVSQTAKSSRVYKQGPKGSNAARSRKANVRGQKENPQSTHSRSKVKNESIHDHVPSQVESPMEAGSGVADEQGLGTTLGDPTLPPCNAWVRCDDCHKWRRIPAALADSIEDTNSNWTCKDNMDKNYADCSIPQEKSNADINAELDISDASCEEDNEDTRVTYKELGSSRLTGPQQSSFVRIDSNKFLHRARRTQTIDEIMVCHCKPPLNGKLGCGDECLNRMLNIECVQGTCPCGDLCSNQQFQKRKYAQMQWFRCGKKGYGLQVLEDVSKGGFIIEYVGEVLDMPAYKARQREYASKGHKHFYFMTLNGNEVIDACAKGNLGRFINHSCDPNCRTEKWMVNGEICIGLFAVRDIKEGEELTFDYNYVRVFGAAAKKCVCGSPQCRGYLGGDPLNTEVIVQGDSDDEYPEPVMLHEDGDILPLMDSVVSRPSSFDDIGTLAAEARAEMNKSMDQSAADVRQLGSSIENEDQKAEVHSSDKLVEIIPLSAARQEIVVEGVSNDSEKSEIFSPLKPLDKLLPDDASRSRTQKSETIDKKSYAKLHPHVKTSRSGSIKKSKDKSSSIVAEKALGIANKSQMVAIKPKKAVEGSLSGRFEAVEEKLNELLDTDGGISKRKDAPKGYLKLLFLTAASGGRGCEAIQSNRDLSMILDALLKTRSRVVLVDIISKNGLQMLHNIMKQYRRDFKKIPILRKLLKVLEYLAVREVLTLEHIASGPPCLGMESFRESILSLTEHEDKQVHQIARNFRDKWIPKSIRKLGFGDRTSAMHNNWPEQSGWPVEAIDCGKQSMHTTGTAVSASQENGRTSCAEDRPASDKRVRKRKSRWDQDAEPIPQLELPLQEHQVSTGKSDCPGSAPEHSLVGTVSSDGSQHNSCEDVPPGFASTPDASQVPSHASSAAVDVSHEKVHLAECPFGAVAGHPQERFVSRLPVSYGIPLYFLQHLGKPNVESMESWTIAPGVPFHPFPPLPHLPRERKRRSPSETIDSQADSHPADSVHLEESSQASVIDESSPGTSNAVVDSEGTCANNQQMFKRMKVSSQDLGRRYFRQQKWNNTKLRPPWIRKRNCWRYPVNNSKGGMSSVGLGNGVHCQKNSSLSGEFNCKLGKEDNNYR